MQHLAANRHSIDMKMSTTALSAGKYRLMRPIVGVDCKSESRESSRLPASAVVDLLSVEPVNHSFVVVRLGSQTLEVSPQDLLQKAIPLSEHF